MIIPSEPKISTPIHLHLYTSCTCCKDALGQVSEVLLEYPRHSVHVALLQQLLRLVRVTLVSSLQIEIELEKEDIFHILMKYHDNLW